MTGPRAIAVLTTGRQDWGILRSTSLALEAHPAVGLVLLVGGTHLSRRHGHTIDEVLEDGIEPAARLDWVGDGDLPADVQASGAIAAVGSSLETLSPDALVLAGDRFETLAAALAATLHRVPIVHLHGGEQTLGAFDDALRHAITKLSHLHLVSHEEHAARVIAMGEDPDTVHVVGAPGLDQAARGDLPDRQTLEASLGIALEPPVVVVTVHPETLDQDPAAAARAVAAAMDAVPATYIVTLPNVDPGHETVRETMRAAAVGPRRVAVEALGTRRYWGLLRVADALLGNSSSAIVEAPGLGLPAVNVGGRQEGRLRGANVIDAPRDPDRVAEALRVALDPATRPRPGPDETRAEGRVGARIADIIAAWRPSVPPRKAPIRLRS